MTSLQKTPWKIAFGKILDSEDKTLCTLPKNWSKDPSLPRLLAAAPDLFNALQALCDGKETGQSSQNKAQALRALALVQNNPAIPTIPTIPAVTPRVVCADFPYEEIRRPDGDYFQSWQEAKNAGWDNDQIWSVTSAEGHDGSEWIITGPPHHYVNHIGHIASLERHDNNTYYEECLSVEGDLPLSLSTPR